MSRSWIPVGVFALCIALALAIAGWPDRRQDEPLSVTSVSTTTALVQTTTGAPPPTSAPPTTPSTVASASRPPASVRVIAFNASAVPGSAGRLSTRLKTLGYAVAPPGPDKTPAKDSSTVMYRPGFDSEAKALAAALELDPSVTQAAESAPAGWGTAEVAVVIGNDVARRA
ncbi:MAG: LytR C-terminal domain-containing protein [Actinomycetota bacterium]|nr:LytR C-terminal domain-containing protein [Actinomycetota bacterium]